MYQLQLQLRHWSKRLTPIDSNSGFDPDSAALAKASVETVSFSAFVAMHGFPPMPLFYVRNMRLSSFMYLVRSYGFLTETRTATLEKFPLAEKMI